MGGVSLLSVRSARSPTAPGRVSERQVLPLLGLGRGGSQRTQKAFGTAMRLCASLFRRRRGPARLRDLFRFCRNCGLYILRSGLSACARHGWYHCPQTVFCVVRKPCAAGYQNDVLCRFWVLVGSASEERREPSEQRCAYARRCPAGVAARRAAQLCRACFDLL